jgi:hypothetical protein
VAVAQDGQGKAAQPGKLPFWCLDRTPRRLRVPYEEQQHQTLHPCGVHGVAAISVSVPAHEVGELHEVYDAIHNTTDGWHFDVPARQSTVQHTIQILRNNHESAINLKLRGSPGGPHAVELVPDVIIEIIY